MGRQPLSMVSFGLRITDFSLVTSASLAALLLFVFLLSVLSMILLVCSSAFTPCAFARTVRSLASVLLATSLVCNIIAMPTVTGPVLSLWSFCPVSYDSIQAARQSESTSTVPPWNAVIDPLVMHTIVISILIEQVHLQRDYIFVIHQVSLFVFNRTCGSRSVISSPTNGAIPHRHRGATPPLPTSHGTFNSS